MNPSQTKSEKKIFAHGPTESRLLALYRADYNERFPSRAGVIDRPIFIFK